MCGRSRCALSEEQVAAAAGVPADALPRRWRGRERFRPSHNATPSHWLPVVRVASDGGRVVDTMK